MRTNGQTETDGRALFAAMQTNLKLPSSRLFCTIWQNILQVLTLTMLSLVLFKARFPSQVVFNVEQKNNTYNMLAFGSNRLPLQSLLSHKLFFLP